MVVVVTLVLIVEALVVLSLSSVGDRFGCDTVGDTYPLHVCPVLVAGAEANEYGGGGPEHAAEGLMSAGAINLMDVVEETAATAAASRLTLSMSRKARAGRLV